MLSNASSDISRLSSTFCGILEWCRLVPFTSAGAIASTHYAKENGVYFVFPTALFCVTRELRPIRRSNNLSLSRVASFFLEDSAWPLLCGYRGLDMLRQILHLPHNSRKLCEMN